MAQGAVDMFLKLDGVTGETLDTAMSGAMDIVNWSWGLQNDGNFHMAGGGGVGKAAVNDITVTKNIDAASATLMQMCVTGQHVATGTLTCRKSGGTPLDYLVIKLSKILVSSYSTQGTGSLQHQENFSLHFAEVNVQYNSQNDQGGKKAPAVMKWKVPANTKG